MCGLQKKCLCLFVTSKTAYSMRTPSPLFFLLQPKVAIELRFRQNPSKVSKNPSTICKLFARQRCQQCQSRSHQMARPPPDPVHLQQSRLHNHTQLIPASREVQSTQRSLLHLAHCGGNGRVFTNEGNSSPSDPSCTGVPL